MRQTKSYRVLARYKSNSRPGVFYRVVQDKKSGRVTCDCPGFTYRQKCWHHARQVNLVCDRGYIF